MSVFRQSGAGSLRLNAPTCRYCAQPVVPDTDLCEAHTGEAGRLLFNPKRAGYRSQAYRIARRAAIRRANGHCEACGKPLPRRAGGRLVCEAHHKDGDPTNNPPDGSNLLVACDRCHCGSRRPPDL